MDKSNAPNILKNDFKPENASIPDDCVKYSDPAVMFKEYEKLATECASILLCNYSSLNMAIEMGFAQSNKKFNS